MGKFLGNEALERAAQRELDAAFNDFLPSIDFDQAEAAVRLEERLKLLNEIGLALSAVRDIDELLELVLSKARELTGADAGSLYLVNTSDTATTADDSLYFRKAQNDSIEVNTTRSFPVSSSSLAGYVALTGKTLCFDDVYHLPANAPYQFNPSFDRENNYCTKSVLVVPLRNHRGGVLGVLQLINRKRHRDAKLHVNADTLCEVLPFDAELVDLAASLASQAAVAIENSRFLDEIRELFESFVKAAASAIEDRDLSTSGHSRRVTNLTLAMAAAAHAATEGPFRDVRFSSAEFKALEFAGLLHDFGKIGVPERILTKSHKLEPAHFEVLKSRLFGLRQERKAHYTELMVRALRGRAGRVNGHAVAEEICNRLEQRMNAEMQELDTLLQLLTRTNDPAVTWMSDEEYAGQQELLKRLSRMTYSDESGEAKPLLDEDEAQALSIRKGSLTREEYSVIQTHAQLSYEFLRKIRWTDEYARIPLIAWGHHEKLNGKGYPRGVDASEIPLETRFMTVADIFDALSASDRPYKKAMPLDRALKILRDEVGDGGLDNDVVELFVNQAIYEDPQRWIEAFNAEHR